MKICELVSESSRAEQVVDLAYDSRKVKPGMLFFAIPGLKVDGAQFVPSAIKAGALACVVSQESFAKVAKELQPNCIAVENVRLALALASAKFFGEPTKKMLVLGVTGTKGKTSTSYLLESILKEAGKKTALQGTVVCRHPGASFHSERTTMESYELQKFLREALEHGANAAIMEVSSHALSLERVAGCYFDGMIFTNLSEDHLDFYGNMENYYEAKRLLFTKYCQLKNGQYPLAASNLENSFGARLIREAKTPIISFGARAGDVHFSSLQIDASGIKAEAILPDKSKIAIESALTGEFNAQNLAGAIALTAQLKIPKDAIIKGIRNMKGVDGRLERVPSSLPFQVFVDFAHMGAALENVLQSLRPLCRGRLVLVVGAGGDRDPSRRTQLGQVAARLADHSVITSDNPRSEDPLKIIAAIEKSFQEELSKHPQFKNLHSYEIIVDRRQAIEKALRAAQAGDLICLAGKGHETGQIIGTTEYPFDDREEAAKVLRVLEK